MAGSSTEHSDGEEVLGLEATELGTYSRNNSTRTSPIREVCVRNDHRHEDHAASLLVVVKTFWRRQISATVAHDACRDHLGAYVSLLQLTMVHPSPNVEWQSEIADA